MYSWQVVRLVAGVFIMGSLAMGIPGSILFVSEWWLAFTAFVVALIYFVHWRFVTSPMKAALQAIRDDEPVAMALGIDVVRTKIIVFTLGGGFAALSGALAAFYFRFVTANSYGLTTIILLWAMLFVGGNCSLAGSLVGPAVLIFFPEVFRFIGGPGWDIGNIQEAMYGLLLILLMLFRPQGLVGQRVGLRS
jgi:branched-chain amino acid transport system permease protein